ncbi:ROK family protein [Candidatus Woesearchaeota archaeon]|nr:ROK family protein [Candidatus Woesearchaeota archaeon]
MKYAIGVDVGGTKIESVLITNNGKILKKYRTPTQTSKGKKTVLQNIELAIKKVWDKPIEGIGIGMPTVINEQGVVLPPSKMPFLHNFNIKKHFQKTLHTNIIIENDANCFILAEHSFGAAKGAKHVVGVILGTGVGSGIIINNQIYHGNNFVAGEVGFMLVDPHSKDRTTYSFAGSFENFCSGPAIVHYYKKFGGKIKNPDPKKIYYSKEPTAKKVIDEFIEHLAIGLANIVVALNPEVIVLGAGLSNLPIYPKLRKEFKKRALKPMQNTKIVKHKISDSSGSIGAAALVFKNV